MVELEKNPSFECVREDGTANTLIANFWLPGLRKLISILSEPQSLWYSIMADIEK